MRPSLCTNHLRYKKPMFLDIFKAFLALPAMVLGTVLGAVIVFIVPALAIALVYFSVKLVLAWWPLLSLSL